MRVSKDKEERRNELINVAESLFLQRGYAETSISDIVRETSVAQGTFYYHFKSKEEVLVAVVQKTAGELDRRVQAIVEKSQTTAAERLRQLIRTVFEFMRQKRQMIEYVHQDSNALLHHRLSGTTVLMIRKHVLALVNEGIQDGIFRVSHPEETVDFFLGGLGGVLHVPEFTGNPKRAAKFRHAAESALERSLGCGPLEQTRKRGS